MRLVWYFWKLFQVISESKLRGKIMDVYVARQPIFDRKMNVHGYELLYRRSKKMFMRV